MTTTKYICITCNKVHTHRFANGYRPFQRWLETCPHCRKYTLSVLIWLINPFQGQAGPVFR